MEADVMPDEGGEPRCRSGVGGFEGTPAGDKTFHMLQQQRVEQMFLGGVIAIERCRLNAYLGRKLPEMAKVVARCGRTWT